MKTIDEKQNEFIETYNGLNDPLMQYEFLLQLAGETPYPDPEEKDSHSRIHNCQTESWFIMHAENERFWLKIDSDSLLIRGVLGIYVYLLNGRTLEEIRNTSLSFMEKTGIKNQLSRSRFSVLAELADEVLCFCQKTYTKPSDDLKPVYDDKA